MIDFHSHVLPGIDDGSKDVETSVAMLEESKRQGVTTIVCTPHYSGRRSPERFKARRNSAYEKLAPHIPEGIELRLGAEVFFTDESVLSNEQLAELCIEGTRYVMLELPFTPKLTERLFDRIESFIAETDCIPLIAHVDRYPAVWKDPNIIGRLIDMGCVIQLNAESFVTKGIKGLAKAVVEKGMVHAIGSDMHDMDKRAPNLKIFQMALLDFSGEIAQKISDTEYAILSNRPIETRSQKLRKFLGKYF